MKSALRVVPFLLSLSACAAQQPSPDPFAAFVKIPPKSVRFVMGEWDFPKQQGNAIQHCTLSVIGGAYVPLLAEGCVYNTGCCPGEGLPLITQSPGVYFEETRKRTYAVQPDGSLLISETGQRLPATPKSQSLAENWK